MAEDQGPEDMDETATLRTKGNDALREGRHEEAIESYSQAIKLSPADHRLFSNRAAAYSKLDKVRRTTPGHLCLSIAPCNKRCLRIALVDDCPA